MADGSNSTGIVAIVAILVLVVGAVGAWTIAGEDSAPQQAQSQPASDDADFKMSITSDEGSFSVESDDN